MALGGILVTISYLSEWERLAAIAISPGPILPQLRVW
jgi:hypothetical protein